LRVDGEAGFARMLAGDAVAGDGPLAVWDRTGQEHGELVGRPVDDLAQGAAHAEAVTVRELDRWDHVDSRVPPLELWGYSGLARDASIAVAVNGTVAAVVPAEPAAYGLTAVHAMLWPEALAGGRNEITMYVVDGPPEAPVLHELAVEAGTAG
jgi:hypothetical protein